MILSHRFAGSLGAAALSAGMLAAAVPAQAAPRHGTGLQAVLHGSRAYPGTGGTATYEAGDHGARELDVRLSHAARLAH